MNSMLLVTTDQGVLRGQKEQLPNGFQFYSFMGIPYAEPPIGELRFKAPRPPQSWIGVRDALREGDGCYSKRLIFDIKSGSEDCLNLNVYTSNLPQENSKNSRLPVMVWFHGGGFFSGSSEREVYDPEFLIDKSIVLVTLNYRLGALGFLCLKDKSLNVHGNAGLKDQNMALKWVQANIRQFGGDPGNVTIFGQSSGAASVCLQMVSPMSTGLFHKAIMQSGVGNCAWAEGKPAAAYDLIEKLGKSAKNDAEVLQILQDISKEELLNAQLNIQDIWVPKQRGVFCPVVENHDNTNELFLPDYPINLIKSGRYIKVPIIIGANSGEGLMINIIEQKINLDLTPKVDEDFVPFNYNLTKGSEMSYIIGEKIRKFYCDDEEPVYCSKQAFYNYVSDAFFVNAILEVAEHIIETSNEKVYMYLFDLKTDVNIICKRIKISGEGVCHSEDISYLFKSRWTPVIRPNSDEDIAIQRMTKWWTNFAKFGDPNGLSEDSVLSIKWPEANSQEMQYMEINNNISIKFKYFEKSRIFWKSIDDLLN